MKKDGFYIIFLLVVFLLIGLGIIFINRVENKDSETVEISNNEGLSNKKIGWGIKREDNHKQPDLGKENTELINKYEGISLGNENKKYIYLSFDEGYEAGYTSKILDTLKENDVKAAFFITGHYLNTSEDLVKRMIEEGHIVGNHF